VGIAVVTVCASQASGVTNVGVIQAATDGTTYLPIFSPKTDLLLVITLCKVTDDLFRHKKCKFSLGVIPLDGVCPPTP